MSQDKPSRPTPADEADKTKKNSRVKTGVAVGIGSAAIVAALLYANRSRRERND